MLAYLLALFVVFASAEVLQGPPPPPPLDGTAQPEFAVLFFWIGGTLSGVQPGNKVPQIIHWTSSLTQAWFDVWTFYHPTAEGIVVETAALRRPVEEHTVENKNIACSYVAYWFLQGFSENFAGPAAGVMGALGLPIDVDYSDLSTPHGLGKYVADQLVEFRNNDGMNLRGDYKRTANFVPYEDYTNYFPINVPWPSPSNNPDHMFDINRWAPRVEDNGAGVQRSMVHVTPQLSVRPFFTEGLDYADLYVEDPVYYRRYRPEAFIAQAQEVIDIQANLTPEQKLLAEFFDDKIISIGFPSIFMFFKYGASLDDFIILETGREMATVDALQVSWYLKRQFDYVRPHNAIPWLFGTDEITAFGGPSAGMTTMAAVDWNSYVPTDFHTEYPSGTTCLINNFVGFFNAAYPQYGGHFGYTHVFAAGSSKVEPGTPAVDTPYTWETLADYGAMVGEARIWAGVHFRKATEVMPALCQDLGVRSYETLLTYVNGAPARKMPTVPKPGPMGLNIGNPAWSPRLSRGLFWPPRD